MYHTTIKICSEAKLLSCIKGNTSAILVHEAINNYNSDCLIGEQLLALSQQVRHSIPRVKCFFFDFDWKLFYSVNFKKKLLNFIRYIYELLLLLADCWVCFLSDSVDSNRNFCIKSSFRSVNRRYIIGNVILCYYIKFSRMKIKY